MKLLTEEEADAVIGCLYVLSGEARNAPEAAIEFWRLAEEKARVMPRLYLVPFCHLVADFDTWCDRKP